ncbi:hypothetical protein DFR67_1236 [Williamsia limnetica]|uniref:Uncharacterized protein n=1 Tax=Williamsia limnetica TaxID=882452 RepID=A0A318RGH2_WILLI|nr:hypothetical protein [Williamsia limnetica]PYE12283.1 hypothetical protein DFR67_1236 [Williamsia limnetica]
MKRKPTAAAPDPVRELPDPQSFAVGDRVTITVGDHAVAVGVIVDDYGTIPDISIDLGDGDHLRPRRFAIHLEDGSLIFRDPSGLAAEEAGQR